MVVIDIDIKNNPNILERIIKALKDTRFTNIGWTIKKNAQWPNEWWETYPHQTPRFFRFDFEVLQFTWRTGDDQAWIASDNSTVIQTIEQMDELLDFVADNTSLFHSPSDDPKMLCTTFDDLFNSDQGIVADTAPTESIFAYQPRPPKKEKKPYNMFDPESWGQKMDDTFITVSKEQLEKLHSFPPLYNNISSHNEKPFTAPHVSGKEDMTYTQWGEMYDKIISCHSVSALHQMHKDIEGLHGAYADSLRQSIKISLEKLQKEETLVEGFLKNNLTPIGYKISEGFYPKLKKLHFLGEKKEYSTPHLPYKISISGQKYEELKKIAHETSVPIMMSQQTKKSSWSEQPMPFDKYQYTKEMKEAVDKVYDEYAKTGHFTISMMDTVTKLCKKPEKDVAPHYPKYESEDMAEWPTSHSVTAAYNKHYPMK